MSKAHTILMVQAGADPQTRTYCDYATLDECIAGICKIYEAHLKQRNPRAPLITYNIAHLFDFIEDLHDVGCLVYLEDSCTYAPYDKDWIKERIYNTLHRQANQGA